MAWTYSRNPGDSPLDLVRFLIGDTDCNDPLLDDNEILYLLSAYNNSAQTAAIRGLEAIILKFSRLADETVGSVSISYSQKAVGMRLARDELISRLAIEDMQPFAGGISRTDKRWVDRNRDRVRPAFTKNEDTNDQVDGSMAYGDYRWGW